MREPSRYQARSTSWTMGSPIASCLGRPLGGPSPYVATCTVQYASSGTHAITARYSGDANFTASASQS